MTDQEKAAARKWMATGHEGLLGSIRRASGSPGLPGWEAACWLSGQEGVTVSTQAIKNILDGNVTLPRLTTLVSLYSAIETAS